MILVDANLLVYAHVGSFQQHENARAWLDAQLNGNSPVGLPWNWLLAFLRIVTNPRVFQKPETMTDAWKQVEEWLDTHSGRSETNRPCRSNWFTFRAYLFVLTVWGHSYLVGP
jgi:toxin-antitoxin system PIN domain toxin